MSYRYPSSNIFGLANKGSFYSKWKELMDCVDKLEKLVRLDRPGRDEVDWPSVERSINLSLPVDYKRLVQRFPPGRFGGFLSLIRPGEYGGSSKEFLGYFENRLNDMRSWREDESDRFPYPIFPEKGGLLPWGITRRGDLFFWRTDKFVDNSDSWAIVLTDSRFSFWKEYSKTVCDFLIDIASGDFDASIFEVDLAVEEKFTPRPSMPQSSRPLSNEEFWRGVRVGKKGATNRSTDLADLLGVDLRAGHPVDWIEVERTLGTRLPDDYKWFIDVYGAGKFCDIKITSPVSTRPVFNLFDLLESRQLNAIQDNKRPTDGMPIYPETGGVISWGETLDGWTVCWAPSVPDPNSWGIVLMEQSMEGYQYFQKLSFSGFLVMYSDPSQLHLFGRDYQDTWKAGSIFTSSQKM